MGDIFNDNAIGGILLHTPGKSGGGVHIGTKYHSRFKIKTGSVVSEKVGKLKEKFNSLKPLSFAWWLNRKFVYKIVKTIVLALNRDLINASLDSSTWRISPPKLGLTAEMFYFHCFNFLPTVRRHPDCVLSGNNAGVWEWNDGKTIIAPKCLSKWIKIWQNWDFSGGLDTWRGFFLG